MEILEVNKKNLNRIIRIAARSVKEGRVLVCPTDTVYGLLADATNKNAVKKIFKIKKRNKKKAVPIFIKDIKTAIQLAEIDKEKEEILEKIWPGKVTAILKRTRLRQGYGGRRKVKLYGVALKTIALRIPDYKLVNVLLARINLPLIATSANVSGQPASTKIKEVISQFRNRKNLPDLILSAGNLKKKLPSTIIDLTKKKPKILRKGEKLFKLRDK